MHYLAGMEMADAQYKNDENCCWWAFLVVVTSLKLLHHSHKNFRKVLCRIIKTKGKLDFQSGY